MSILFNSNETILFIGDSITDAGRTNHLPPFGGGYMSMFRNKIITNHPELDLTFINKGISGNTLEGLELRWQHDVLDYQPDHLFIMIGINDAAVQLESLKDDEIALKEFYDQFKRILQQSVDSKIGSIYIMTPFYINSDPSSPLLKMTLKYIDKIRTICSEFDIKIIDIHEYFQIQLLNNDASFLSGDGVHPKDYGHNLIANVLYNWTINEK